MNLHNNKVERELALDPNNRGKAAEKIIQDAISDGKLRIETFQIEISRDCRAAIYI